MAGYKLGRVTSDIKLALSELLREVKDPRVSSMLSIVKVDVSGDLGDGLYAMAATNGKERGILITNIGAEKEIETNLGRGYIVYQIDEKHFMTKKRVSVKKFVLKQYDTLYIEKFL